jgi:phosphopantothenoylcysteine synthetase/decarboxylase
MKVLLTCGPTMVALDDTRVITNLSTGEMGELIAESFKKAGHKVTVLKGPMFFDEFAKRFKEECKKQYDIVIHAAAVADFKPAKTLKAKVSSKKGLTLKLVPTEKLIDVVKRLAPKTFLVGFKLESSLQTAIADARKLFTDSGCDLVVANAKVKGYQGVIIDADGNTLAKANNKSGIASNLVRILK